MSAYVAPGGTPPWFARISYYRDPFSPAVSLAAQTSVQDVLDAIREWLESVVGDAQAADDASATGR